jgi:hypothetical protein
MLRTDGGIRSVKQTLQSLRHALQAGPVRRHIFKETVSVCATGASATGVRQQRTWFERAVHGGASLVTPWTAWVPIRCARRHTSTLTLQRTHRKGRGDRHRPSRFHESVGVRHTTKVSLGGQVSGRTMVKPKSGSQRVTLKMKYKIQKNVRPVVSRRHVCAPRGMGNFLGSCSRCVL